MISWMPKYFQSLGVDLANVGWFTVIPYLGMFLMSNTSGLVSSALQSRGFQLINIRRITQTVAFLTPCLFFTLLCFTKTPELAVVFLTFALCGSAWSHSGFWVNMIDISPRYAAYILGLSNTFASLAGSLGNLVTGYILDVTKSWVFVFLIVVFELIVALIFFLIFVKGHVLFK